MVVVEPDTFGRTMVSESICVQHTRRVEDGPVVGPGPGEKKREREKGRERERERERLEGERKGETRSEKLEHKPFA